MIKEPPKTRLTYHVKPILASLMYVDRMFTEKVLIH